MSHITIIINRSPSPSTSLEHSASDACSAHVEYRVPHDATDNEVERMAMRLYKQVKKLGLSAD